MCNVPFGPVVVAKQSFLNQTASLPATTIYTPTEDGFFLVQTYLTVSAFAADSSSGGGTVLIGYTDPAAAESFEGVSINSGLQQGPTGNGFQNTIYALSGEPITLSVNFSFHDPDQTYSAYVTVIRT